MLQTSPSPAKEGVVRTIRIGEVELGAEIVSGSVDKCQGSDCRGHCCRFGAVLEENEIPTIEGLLPRLLPLLRLEARQSVRRNSWVFRKAFREPYGDPDRRYRSIRVCNGTCVFVMEGAKGGCALHKLALEDQVPVHQYKPRECYLFPLTEMQVGQLRLHTWPEYHCTREAQGPPLYQAFSEELRYVLGSSGYRELLRKIELYERAGVHFSPLPFEDPPPIPRGRPPGKSR